MKTAQVMLREATGLNLSKAVVDRAIKARMQPSASADVASYLAAMTPDELTALVELVVVPESWFYRDAQAFQAMLDFIRQRSSNNAAARPVRILSIPCAGGEEPYTIAMVLADAGLPPDSYSIEAYDISPACIERARSGIYGRNAFRSSDLSFRERHFSSAGDDDYRISDALRQQVRFRQGNLLEFDLSARLGYFDVVFCRNLLIYFDQPTTQAAIKQLAALLADDGLLFAGYAEVHSFCQHGFAPLQHAQAFGLRKESAAARIAGAASQGATRPPTRAQRASAGRPQSPRAIPPPLQSAASNPALVKPPASELSPRPRRTAVTATATVAATAAALAATPTDLLQLARLL
ncbi:MAG: protein-glutamate O-methyltransferase CheR, partial [Sphingomonadaceae bacterium]